MAKETRKTTANASALDLANPPFNMSDWGGETLRQDVRWKFGMPPASNANYAWIQHFIHHLSLVGVAEFVMANGSMSMQISNEGEMCNDISKSTAIVNLTQSYVC